jgi:hypothetical protein
MLLRQEDDGLLAIGQPSHSWISGQLARAWGNQEFGTVEPYEDVCLAAEQHDLGMGPWDADPDVNRETGLPFSFTEMPVTLHVRQWTDGPRRLLVQSRWAALLASLHGSRLQRRRNVAELSPDDADAVRTYLAEQEAFQDRLIASLRPDPELLRRNHQLLWIWDFLSLALCLSWAPTTAHEVPSAARPAELELVPHDERSVSIAPWPFASSTLTVRCEGRRLTDRYRSSEAMRAALADAPWETLEFTLFRK